MGFHVGNGFGRHENSSEAALLSRAVSCPYTATEKIIVLLYGVPPRELLSIN